MTRGRLGRYGSGLEGCGRRLETSISKAISHAVGGTFLQTFPGVKAKGFTKEPTLPPAGRSHIMTPFTDAPTSPMVREWGTRAAARPGGKGPTRGLTGQGEKLAMTGTGPSSVQRIWFYIPPLRVLDLLQGLEIAPGRAGKAPCPSGDVRLPFRPSSVALLPRGVAWYHEESGPSTPFSYPSNGW